MPIAGWARGETKGASGERPRRRPETDFWVGVFWAPLVAGPLNCAGLPVVAPTRPRELAELSRAKRVARPADSAEAGSASAVVAGRAVDAFESARDGEGQIFRLPGGGGAARKVTAVATIDPTRMAAAGASYGGHIDKLVSGAHGQIQDARHALRRV